MQSVEQDQDFFARHPVVHPLAVAPGVDQPFVAQHAQLLRQGGLVDGGQVFQFGDRAFAADELAQQQQPVGVGKAFQKRRSGAGIGLEKIDLHERHPVDGFIIFFCKLFASPLPHYNFRNGQPRAFGQDAVYLVDSGGHYDEGTTDITRTIALGELAEEEKTDYTLILKGHIALAMAKFPAGTRGAQLNVLARMPIWSHGMNFLHGTGHGVGHFLSVHEGPQSIRMNENPIVLQPGMVTSNEPGVYKAGSHGIRTENLTLVCKDKEGMFGEYFKFETITLCPICKKGIIKEMLTAEEVKWFNDYHQTVYKKLSPSLNEEEKKWLLEATKAI